MSGFEFCETMSGAVRMEGERSQRAFSLAARARSGPWSRFLRRPEVVLEGEIDAEGFADHRPVRGTLGMDVLRTAALPYELTFVANDGLHCRFVGRKTLHLAHLITSMTVLPGEILDAAGSKVGDALLRFDLGQDLRRFLASFKLAH